MFCPACAAANLEAAGHCAACRSPLDVSAPIVREPRMLGRLGRLLALLRIVPVALALLALVGVGGAYARQVGRQANAYGLAEAALARGDAAAALRALDRAGGYRDAETRRIALAVELAPVRADQLAAGEALSLGDTAGAIAALTSILRDHPGDRDAAALLAVARGRHREALFAGSELAASRKDWLTAEVLLAQLVAEEPDPAHLAALAEIRRRRSPVLFTVGGTIQMAAPDGSDVVTILDGHAARFPMWSPDRQSIAFYTEVGETHVSFNLWVIDRHGGALRLVAESVYPESFPAWSPDGTRIAYISQRPFLLAGRQGITSIRVVEVATGRITDLTDTAVYQALSPSWSPDGRRVAFLSQLVYGRGATVTWRQVGSIYVADLDRGDVTDVTTDRLRFVESVAWSPVSDQLLLWAKETPTSWRTTTITTIHRLDLAAGTLTPVTGRDRYVTRPVWAPDGQRFAYLDDDRVVTIVELDGSSRRIPLSGPMIAPLSWSPDGASLLAPSLRPQYGSPIVPMDVAAGVGFHFPIAFDLSGELIGPPRWGTGWPATPPLSPPLSGTALDPL